MRFRTKSVERNKGFSLVEILVVLIIISILAAISIPKYLSSKTRGYYTIAQSDGESMYREINATMLGVTSFGTTNGAIVLNPSTSLLTITLGAGATSPATFPETVTKGTVISGVTYANTLNWCLDSVNNGASVVFNQDGFQQGVTACP